MCGHHCWHQPYCSVAMLCNTPRTPLLLPPPCSATDMRALPQSASRHVGNTASNSCRLVHVNPSRFALPSPSCCIAHVQVQKLLQIVMHVTPSSAWCRTCSSPSFCCSAASSCVRASSWCSSVAILHAEKAMGSYQYQPCNATSTKVFVIRGRITFFVSPIPLKVPSSAAAAALCLSKQPSGSSDAAGSRYPMAWHTHRALAAC